MPEARLDGCLQWAQLTSGHIGCNRFVDFFGVYSRLTLSELPLLKQAIAHSCGCDASKHSHPSAGD